MDIEGGNVFYSWTKFTDELWGGEGVVGYRLTGGDKDLGMDGVEDERLD